MYGQQPAEQPIKTETFEQQEAMLEQEPGMEVPEEQISPEETVEDMPLEDSLQDMESPELSSEEPEDILSDELSDL